MVDALDALDRNILRALQDDATRPLDELAALVGSSKTPVWNRIRKLKERGVIKKQVAVLDPRAVGLTSCFYVLIRTARHEKAWLDQFVAALKKRPEVLEAHRLAGDVDYILKVRVADADAYDTFYRSLVSDVSIFNVTSLLSMEEIISET
ncbi:MAG: Lrp/AsnC family transcriptional regulator, partial [Geminicoccaceae bacterium]